MNTKFLAAIAAASVLGLSGCADMGGIDRIAWSPEGTRLAASGGLDPEVLQVVDSWSESEACALLADVFGDALAALSATTGPRYAMDRSRTSCRGSPLICGASRPRNSVVSHYRSECRSSRDSPHPASGRRSANQTDTLGACFGLRSWILATHSSAIPNRSRMCPTLSEHSPNSSCRGQAPRAG